MEVKKQWYALLLAAFLLFQVPFLAVQLGGSTARLSFAPQSATVNLYTEQDIEVVIENVAGLYAFDIRIGYNPATIKIIDADPGTLGIQINQGAFLDDGITVINQVDEHAGVISLGLTQLNPSLARSGSGVLLAFRVRGIKVGSSQLSFENVQLSDRDGFELKANSIPATLIVPIKIYIPLFIN